jgi:FMN-dependent NADH-azoreductase
LLLTTPIHNFTVPANLKNWIDLIVRHGRTFRYAEGQSPGMLCGKRAVVLVAYGLSGYVGVDAPPASDQLQPYLRHVLGFIGVHDVEFLGIDGTVFSPEGLPAQRAVLQERMRTLVAALADQLTR